MTGGSHFWLLGVADACKQSRLANRQPVQRISFFFLQREGEQCDGIIVRYSFCYFFCAILRYCDVMTISDAVLGLQRFQGLRKSLKTIHPDDFFFSCGLSDFCLKKKYKKTRSNIIKSQLTTRKFSLIKQVHCFRSQNAWKRTITAVYLDYFHSRRRLQ